MKKIKRFYREHRVFTILMAVVIVCVILLCTLLIQCFYTGNKDKYGDRLDDISKYEIKEERFDAIEKEQTETSEGFLLQGCRNSNGNGLSWNNDREVVE